MGWQVRSEVRLWGRVYVWQTLFPDVIIRPMVSDAEAASTNNGWSAQTLTPADPFGVRFRSVYTPRQKGLTRVCDGMGVEGFVFNRLRA